MQVQNFELNDFNKPVKMHFEYKKYWEIKMEEDRGKILVGMLYKFTKICKFMWTCDLLYSPFHFHIGTDKFKTIRRAGKF